jgi:hypothetical protein
MNNYPSQILSPVYPYPVVRQYSSQPYYYYYNEYPSSSLLTPVTHTSHPRDRYSTSLKYYDDKDAYFSEYHHSRHSHHRQYSNTQKPNRARNISR